MNIRWSVLPLLLLLGCADTSEPSHGVPHGNPIHVASRFSGATPMKVVCTTGMVADLVRNIGGDRVAVVQLMGDGVDPHLYKVSPGDVAKLAAADLILFNGLHLEGKLGEIFTRLARQKPAFALGEHLPPKKLLGSRGAFDPHLWFDVSLWRMVADLVCEVLVQFDPDEAEGYRVRHAEYAARLDALHAWVHEQIEQIPAQRRVLVTAHDAFRYFGRAYGIEVRGIQGISTESEAGLREINALVDYLVSRKIKAVFVESSVSTRNVTALLEGCKARGHRVVVGGELYSDAMGAAGTPEGTYEGMIKHNIGTIVEALR
jgi:manganese/zinc/iron transport system substrate-binding protein